MSLAFSPGRLALVVAENDVFGQHKGETARRRCRLFTPRQPAPSRPYPFSTGFLGLKAGLQPARLLPTKPPEALPDERPRHYPAN
ncbi:MAG: hypothetical protein KDE56_31490 [Anaerolineales bacterium]|nr:hypothetical protein [Anaerolineales bacterium]